MHHVSQPHLGDLLLFTTQFDFTHYLSFWTEKESEQSCIWEHSSCCVTLAINGSKIAHFSHSTRCTPYL